MQNGKEWQKPVVWPGNYENLFIEASSHCRCLLAADQETKTNPLCSMFTGFIFANTQATKRADILGGGRLWTNLKET